MKGFLALGFCPDGKKFSAIVPSDNLHDAVYIAFSFREVSVIKKIVIYSLADNCIVYCEKFKILPL